MPNGAKSFNNNPFVFNRKVDASTRRKHLYFGKLANLNQGWWYSATSVTPLRPGEGA